MSSFNGILRFSFHRQTLAVPSANEITHLDERIRTFSINLFSRSIKKKSWRIHFGVPCSTLRLWIITRIYIICLAMCKKVRKWKESWPRCTHSYSVHHTFLPPTQPIFHSPLLPDDDLCLPSELWGFDMAKQKKNYIFHSFCGNSSSSSAQLCSSNIPWMLPTTSREGRALSTQKKKMMEVQ